MRRRRWPRSGQLGRHEHDPVRTRRGDDLDQPVGLILMGIMEFVTDDDEAYGIVDRLLHALAPGSHMALYDGTNILHGEASDKVAQIWNEVGSAPLVMRSPEGIARFFSSLRLVDPGVVYISHWRPELDPTAGPEPPQEVDALGGVGRKL